MENHIEERLKKELGKIKGIRLAYLFGSAAGKQTDIHGRSVKMKKLSDIDVGILLDESFESRKAHMEAIGAVEKAAERKRFADVVVMNKASPMLNYEIIKYGILLIGDKTTKVEFEANAVSTFLDRKFYYDRHAKYVIRRIAESGLNVQ